MKVATESREWVEFGTGLILESLRRLGQGEATHVDLPPATAAAWLVGRHGDTELPALAPWL
jgi:hypothetical protein